MVVVGHSPFRAERPSNPDAVDQRCQQCSPLRLGIARELAAGFKKVLLPVGRHGPYPRRRPASWTLAEFTLGDSVEPEADFTHYVCNHVKKVIRLFRSVLDFIERVVQIITNKVVQLAEIRLDRNTGCVTDPADLLQYSLHEGALCLLVAGPIVVV